MKIYERHLHPELAHNIICDTETKMWFGEIEGSWKYREMMDEIAAETAEIVDAPPIPTPDPVPVPRIATSLVATKKDILLDTDWDPIGGVSVNASFYVPDLTKAFAIVQFEHKAVGTQAQLRLVEIDADENVRVLAGPYDIPASAKFKTGKMQTNAVPGAGDMTYELQGRLNGATSASVRYGSVVLIELVG